MMFEHPMCSSYLQRRHVNETGRQLLAKTMSPFLNKGQMFAKDHSSGITPVFNDCRNKCAKTGPSSSASSFKILGCN